MKPCWQASNAVARTQPLVLTPLINRVSTLDATSVEARVVPKNALAYCFVMTVSPAAGTDHEKVVFDVQVGSSRHKGHCRMAWSSMRT